MEKMHNLLTREDIQIILKSAESKSNLSSLKINSKADQPGSPSKERSQSQHPIQKAQAPISNQIEVSENLVETNKNTTISVQEAKQGKKKEIILQEPERNVEEFQKISENNEKKEDGETYINEQNTNERKVNESIEFQNLGNKEEQLQSQHPEEKNIEEDQTKEAIQKQDKEILPSEEREAKEETVNEPSSKVEEQEKNKEEQSNQNENINDETTLKEENKEIKEKDLEPEKAEIQEEAKEEEETKSLQDQKEEEQKVEEEEDQGKVKEEEETKSSQDQKKGEPKAQTQEIANHNYSIENNDDMFDIGDDDD